VACKQATAVIQNLDCFAIDKSGGADKFDSNAWRLELAQAAVKSLTNHRTVPYEPVGPFKATVTMRDGEAAAAKLARRWRFIQNGAQIRIQAADMMDLYLELIKLCYLTPAIEKILPLALMIYHLQGRIGIIRARRRLKRRLQRQLP
jgi:hypothetical protein